MKAFLTFLCLTNIVFVCCHYKLVTYVNFATIGQNCILGNIPGVLSYIPKCPALQQPYQDRIGYVKIYGFIRNIPVVCCPLSTMLEVTTPPKQIVDKVSVPVGELSKTKCEEYIRRTNSSFTKQIVVFGGVPSLAKEYPHMAALGYGTANDIKWLCGGSLISEQFILTAGHCLLTVFGPVQWVRLGDLDLASETDDAEPQTYSVIERIPHPDYKPPSSYNDIGLLKLDSEVRFTGYVKPICMPVTAEVLGNLLATGWGKIETGEQSSHLLKVALDPFSHEDCNQTYLHVMSVRKLQFGIVNETQLCAGGKDAERDTCQGDSGGPLQVQHVDSRLYDIVGVTSFGLACGIINSPGVYTRVSYYVPWIESIVWSE